MNKYKMQQIFDKSVFAIREQRVKSIDRRGACSYRAKFPGGPVLKCAVGHLIPDDRYSVEMEGLGVTNLVKKYKDAIPGITAADLKDHRFEGFLIDLQSSHDTRLADPNSDATVISDGLKDFLRSMRRLAKRHGLDPQVAT